MRTLIITLLSLIWLCAYAEKYALLVQVTQYKEQATQENLNGIPPYVGDDPSKVDNIDVQLMEQAIRRFGFNNIVTLVDEQATREAVLREMDAIARKAQSGDVVLFYFTGHGAAARTGFNLAPYDAKPTDASNDIHSDKLYEWASGLRAGLVVIILDSCFHAKPYTIRPPAMKPKLIEARSQTQPDGWGRVETAKNTVVLTASSLGQAAYQTHHRTSNTGRKRWVGVFTLYLSQALEQKAASNQPVTYRKLVESIREPIEKFFKSRPDMHSHPEHSKLFPKPQLLGDAALFDRTIFEPVSEPVDNPPLPTEKVYFEPSVPDDVRREIEEMFIRRKKAVAPVDRKQDADYIVSMHKDVPVIVANSWNGSNTELPTPPPTVTHPTLKRLIESVNQTPEWLSVRLDKSSYRVGEPIRVTVDLKRSGYLILVSEDGKGNPSVLYPYPGLNRQTPAGVHTFPDREGVSFTVNKSPVNTVIAMLLQDETDYLILLSLLRNSRGTTIEYNLDELLRGWVQANKCSIRYTVFSIQ